MSRLDFFFVGRVGGGVGSGSFVDLGLRSLPDCG